MKVFAIYDDRRPEKLEPLLNEFKTQGIEDYLIVPPIPDKDSVVRSINLSHKHIVLMAIENNLPMVSVFEDDVQFVAPGAWQYFLSKMPSYFDLYLAGCYSPIKQGWDTDPYFYTTEPVGLHCYIIHSRYYNAFLSTDENVHIDTAQKGLIKVCHPFAALQRAGYSANNRCDQNYNSILKPEDIYHG